MNTRNRDKFTPEISNVTGRTASQQWSCNFRNLWFTLTRCDSQGSKVPQDEGLHGVPAHAVPEEAVLRDGVWSLLMAHHAGANFCSGQLKESLPEPVARAA